MFGQERKTSLQLQREVQIPVNLKELVKIKILVLLNVFLKSNELIWGSSNICSKSQNFTNNTAPAPYGICIFFFLQLELVIQQGISASKPGRRQGYLELLFQRKVPDRSLWVSSCL